MFIVVCECCSLCATNNGRRVTVELCYFWAPFVILRRNWFGFQNGYSSPILLHLRCSILLHFVIELRCCVLHFVIAGYFVIALVIAVLCSMLDSPFLLCSCFVIALHFVIAGYFVIIITLFLLCCALCWTYLCFVLRFCFWYILCYNLVPYISCCLDW